MGLTLYIDGPAWRDHLRETAAAFPGLVPVAKGNGYGFGIARLARKADWLGVDMVAVGTYREVPEVLSRFAGSVLVLAPWRPPPSDVVYGPRVVHTVGRLADLEALTARPDRPRVVLERLTSMLRHGFSATDLRAAGALLRATGAPAGRGVVVEGSAMHLPIRPGASLPEAQRTMTDIVAAGLPSPTVFVSHLDGTELDELRAEYPDFELRPRVGTHLWLGRREALAARATVLDAHPVQRGDVFGYRGRTAPRRGTILIVAGGTASGIGLEAPPSNTSLKQRAATIARGGLDAAGFARSPYTIDGKQRLFAEPPHMQVSMLFLPSGALVPEIGEEVDVRVRFTATTFDAVVTS